MGQKDKWTNGILLSKLFSPTATKNCSSDREKLLKFEAEGKVIYPKYSKPNRAFRVDFSKVHSAHFGPARVANSILTKKGGEIGLLIENLRHD